MRHRFWIGPLLLAVCLLAIGVFQSKATSDDEQLIGSEQTTVAQNEVSSSQASETETEESVEATKVSEPVSSLIPSIPLCITIAAISVDHYIVEYTDEMVIEKGGVDPIKWDDVAWWSGGGRPGATLDNTPASSAQDYTTYLYGHTGTNGKAVFNDIGLLESGDKIVLETDTDQFIYAVEQIFTVRKTDLMSDSRATEDTPGRLLLISCSPSNSDRDNIVVVANLINSP